jgi:hypothetical protein
MNIKMNTSMNNNSSTTPVRPRLVSFYPNIQFHEGRYIIIGAGPSKNNNRCYGICDYCEEYKQMYVLDQPIYYEKGARRRLVSYCVDCSTF